MSSPSARVPSANSRDTKTNIVGSARGLVWHIPALRRRKQVSFWLDRHKELSGDIRSVGNRGLSVAENEAIYADARADFAEALIAIFDPPLGRSIADLGCGIGLYANTAIAAGMDYVGVDPSPEALKQARKICPSGKFRKGNIATFRADKRFDAILLGSILCHLVDDRLFDASVKNLRRLLARDGTIFIFDHFPETERLYRDYVRHRTFADFTDRFAAAGFSVLRRPARRELYLARPTGD